MIGVRLNLTRSPFGCLLFPPWHVQLSLVRVQWNWAQVKFSIALWYSPYTRNSDSLMHFSSVQSSISETLSRNQVSLFNIPLLPRYTDLWRIVLLCFSFRLFFFFSFSVSQAKRTNAVNRLDSRSRMKRSRKRAEKNSVYHTDTHAAMPAANIDLQNKLNIKNSSSSSSSGLDDGSETLLH